MRIGLTVLLPPVYCVLAIWMPIQFPQEAIGMQHMYDRPAGRGDGLVSYGKMQSNQCPV